MLRSKNNRAYILIICVVLLLLTGWLRLQHIVEFVEWPDEIWSVWHVRGTFQEAMTRVPYDWPPLFSAITWLWQQLAGDRLEAARYMMILFSLLGGALTYRSALSLNRLTQKPVQKNAIWLLSMLVWAIAAYSIFAGIDVRAYGLLLSLGMLAFWLTLRWMHIPTWKRGLMLAVALAALFYASYTSLPFIAFLGGFVLILRPRHFLKGVVVVLTFLILCIPLLPGFLAEAAGRFQVMPQPILPFGEALVSIFRDFGGSNGFLIPLVLGILLMLIAFIRFPEQRRLILLLTLWISPPIAVYFVTDNREFWRPRYMWWVLDGLVLFIGYALSYLPRPAYGVAILGLILLPLLPVDWFDYRLSLVSDPPFRQTLSWMAQHLRPGDVIVIDPKCTCGDGIGWDYFVPQYFPTGYLPIVDRPGTASRVWYVSTDGWAKDEKLLAEVQQGRKASIFVGPWNFLWRLYEGPPSWTGVTFGDAVRFHGVEVENNTSFLPEDKTIQLKLWWSAAKPLNLDYSIGIVLMDRRGKIVAQIDGPAVAPDTPSQTSQWQPGTYYEDYRTLQIPPQLDAGIYTLAIGVYQWWDNVHLKPEANTLYPDRTDFDYLIIRKFTVQSY